MKHKMIVLYILLPLVIGSVAAAEDWKSVLDLRGKWKFELGDDEKRASAAFNDSKWGEIFVPSAWEDEGYPGYDGYAWYRKHFRLPEGAEKKTLYLRLGCIDDVSEVYFNGVLIGITGNFPPDYMTAYNVEVVLYLPPNLLNVSGDNIISVRVYDAELAGGMTQGKIGLFEPKFALVPDISFAGKWRFKTGDSEKWADLSFDDHAWNQLFVPAYWESQGYPGYDGVAWYRLHFKLPAEFSDKTTVLLLGKIDDLDETYINGEEIGRTGRIRSNPARSSLDGEYREFRAYTIPTSVLKPGDDNVIAIRVYDGGGPGGIYEGPIGILTREHYKELKKKQSWQDNAENGWRNIFDKIFDN
jgi:Glycosyl hydrolases family 2, sugar binding domain